MSKYNKPINKQQVRRYQENTVPPKEQLLELTKIFINSSLNPSKEYELEAKFGTRGIKYITKMDYDNVVKKLKSLNFVSSQETGYYSLRVQPEFLDVRTGEYKNTGDFEKFRVEVDGLTNIQEYCKTNDIRIVNDKSPNNVRLMRKLDVRLEDKSETFVQSANFDDFNFRVTLKTEETVSKTSKIGIEVFNTWNQAKKVFRYINRVSFKNDNYPFQFDLSIVRESSKNERRRMIQTYNIQESGVFTNPETYEIEIEVLKRSLILPQFSKMTAETLSSELQRMVKYVLCGLQKTNYPISYPEQRLVASSYLRLLFEEEFKARKETYVPKDRLYPSDFIGPGLVTLGIENIAPINPDITVPNITAPYSYCVTEKADGDRHLLFVNEQGKIYLINMNMNVIFTGAKTNEERCFNSILDGELILHNKEELFINQFAAFDIYYINKVDVRARPFIKVPTKEDKYFEEGCRLPLLKDFIKILNPVSINSSNQETKGAVEKILTIYKKENKSPISIVSKKFYPMFGATEEKDLTNLDKYNIFEASNYILKKIGDNLFEYDIDGLIFTPTLLGVGSNKMLEAGPKKKITWDQCFKWKPSEATQIFPKSYNTIDFLVFTKKGPDGNDIVTPIFENGLNFNESTQYNQYKTLILSVGFDEKKHGYINPCQDLLDDRFSEPKDVDNEDTYKPKQFFPSNPYDAQAGLCNIMLELDSNGSYQMFSEEREVFDDQTVVEFRYEITKPGLWKWIPLRVRYDKTAEYRQGLNSFGNDYKTANSNWHSIHNPVTEKMISTGQDIPGIEVSDDVYYNSVSLEKLTVAMRDFHNLYVKKSLIQGVSRRGNILIDLACGKGGDFPKWIASNLSFVFGIDISKDNIENRLNGACARYLSFKKTTKNMPYALFVNGNVGLNIRNGTNMFTDKANQITKAVFGEGSVDSSLGPAVQRQKGKGANGFDCSSCQFAIHYLFENNKTFYNFIRNIAECTKLNGYFIATCYDGKTIFNMLKKKQQGESIEIYKDDRKVWSITKQYDATMFEDNDSSLGYKIDVYQDSINQTISEWLVNYDFLISTMDKYGFSLISRDEAKQMGLPEGSGMFIELFNSMMNEIKRNPDKSKDYGNAPQMTSYEKDISFLNRYFVFKKISTRNAEQLTRSILEQLPDEIVFEQAGTMLARESVKKAEQEMKPRAKKIDKKIKLQQATEAFEADEKQDIKATKKKVSKKKKVELVEVMDD